MIAIKLYVFGLLYKCVRKLAIWTLFIKQDLFRQSRDIESIVEWGEKRLLNVYQSYRALIFTYLFKNQKPIYFCGLEFKSPITVAAYQGNLGMLKVFLALGAGSCCFKTITLQARQGNPRPRLMPICVDNQSALLNALGLPGKGIDAFLESLESFDFPDSPMGISIGGHSEQEYFVVFKKINHFLQIKKLKHIYLELNVSCPNTETGQLLLERIDKVEHLIKLFREQTDLAISVKLAPFLTNSQIVEYANMVLKYNNVFLNCGNTQPLESNLISVGKGGLSGKPLFARNLEIAKLLKPLNVPLMITGGIHKADHIKQLQKQGVSLFGLATAVIENPFAIAELNLSLSNEKD